MADAPAFDPPRPGPDIAANLAAVGARVTRAATAAGREADTIALVAVSKGHGEDRLRPALEAGHRVFGENRVQEAQAKWPALKDAWPDLQLHLIGPLQTNKAQDAVALFEVIESLDRERLADRLAAAMARTGRRPRLMIQVNTGQEAQKAGVDPARLDALLDYCRAQAGLTIDGLMAIPPREDNPALHFAWLHDAARQRGLGAISMGMSHDFETAIAYGATQVRVGTAIFGERAGAGAG